MALTTTLNPATPSSKVIIAVDDAPDNLFLLNKVVDSAGFAFIGAASGLECLSLMLRFIPRLILLDVEMPSMDGFETCRRLRENPALIQVPIAFLTNRKSVDDVSNGLTAGGNDFIVKPFSRAGIVERIQHWTARRVA